MLEAATLALAGSPHDPERRLDVPPGLGVFLVAAFFKGAGLLRGSCDGLVAVHFQKLPRVLLNLHFLHCSLLAKRPAPRREMALPSHALKRKSRRRRHWFLGAMPVSINDAAAGLQSLPLPPVQWWR